jgi:hypothetical protein
MSAFTQSVHSLPRDVRSVASFIGMANFDLKFFPNFVKLADPLNNFPKKGVHFHWRPEQDQAFQKLKVADAQPPILRVPIFTQGFTLQTDARGVNLAVILSQQHEGVQLPIAYPSRALTAQEKTA